MSTMLRRKRRKIPTQEKILQRLAASDSELSDLSLSDDDDDWPSFQTDKKYVPVLEGESSSDEHDVETDLTTRVSAEKTGFDLDRPSSSKSPEPIPQSSKKVQKMKKKGHINGKI